MIEVQKYNPQWSNRFQSLTSQFMPHIENIALEVLHVGDTSIIGMSANPSIDINIIVEDFSRIDDIANKLSLVGYSKDMEETDSIIFKHNKSVPHSLKIVKKDSLVLKSKLLLKKHFEENPTSLNEYQTIKNKFLNRKISEAKFFEIEKKLKEVYLGLEGMSSDEITLVL